MSSDLIPEDVGCACGSQVNHGPHDNWDAVPLDDIESEHPLVAAASVGGSTTEAADKSNGGAS